MWPCGGAWLCQALWDHYEYNLDEAWLRRFIRC
jgi:alpha-L-fucosidase 2